MKNYTTFMIILLNSLLFANLLAQEMPLVYDVENTGADVPLPYLPSFSELPVIQPLPDPFEWGDGRGRMTNYSDWRLRRAEIGNEIQYYEIGQKPARPDTIDASFSYTDSILTVNVTVNGHTLTLTSKVYLPDGAGPFPAVIGMNSPNGAIPSYIFTSRNIARIQYNHDQVTKYAGFPGMPPPTTNDPFYRLYPNLNLDNTGQYSPWAWGVSRLIDGLELVQDNLPIDLHHIAVTGCSYAGKLALFAGALDERIALTIAQESGGGGAPSWRYSQFDPENVEKIDNTDYNWFRNSMGQFSGNNVSRMPEDHDELMAMVAPRALFVTGDTSFTWLSNPSCYVSSMACKEVYKTLGIADRFGFFIDGAHGHCEVPQTQVPPIEAFVDKFLLGIDTVNTDVGVTPFDINLNPWITWENPTLSNDTTYYTSLVYPANSQTALDTAITFRWKNVKGAQKYLIQLSTDAAFTEIVISDSTTTDTSKTLTNLVKSTKYYWRVKVKSVSGSGPWSDQWSLVTTLSAPIAPQPISAFSDQTGYITLRWKKVDTADRYSIQVSQSKTFNNIFKSVSTSDTVETISWFKEAIKYYWRIQARNIAGTSNWSNANDFTLLSAPTELVLQNSAFNEITLNWKDNSTVEDGYIIERKQEPETSFSLRDTLKKSGGQYVDQQVENGQTYTYRIKAYKDSIVSNYSNEASLLVTTLKDKTDIPKEYSINQNYPNPFNPTTKIKFALPIRGLTKISVYDLLGREIRTLINREMEAGYHDIYFDAADLPSGIYFYRIHSGNFSQTKKMILMK